MKYDNYDGLTVTFVMVFKVDGLDEEGIKEDLEKDADILDVMEDTIGYLDDDGKEILEPVKGFVLRAPLEKYLGLRFEYNCYELDGQKYVLYPMAKGEKEKAIAMNA